MLSPTASLIDYTALYLLQDYLTSYELVAAGLSVKAATNIAVLVPFAGVPGQFAAAFLVKYTRRYKWITVSGYALNMLGLGLAYKYINGHYHLGALVVSQLILGFGEGVINTMQFGMQASVSQAGRIPCSQNRIRWLSAYSCRHGLGYCFVHCVTRSGKCHWRGSSRWGVDWYVMCQIIFISG